MRDILSDHVYYNGPTAFTAQEVAAQGDLFAHRAALYHTASENIPPEWIGEGPLDIRLPLPTPDYLEYQEVRAYGMARLWVDLLQRASAKIRWTVMYPAEVVLTRFERATLREDHLMMGAKAARDALKLKTTGRSDGLPLYYFGAIVDDDQASSVFHYRQEIVSAAHDCGLRIEVKVPSP